MYLQTVVGDEAVDEFREKLFGECGGNIGLMDSTAFGL
jgi:hypothetical protein